MVAKDADGNKVQVLGLILSNNYDIRRFYNCLKIIEIKKHKQLHEEIFDYKSLVVKKSLSNCSEKIEFKNA